MADKNITKDRFYELIEGLVIWTLSDLAPDKEVNKYEVEAYLKEKNPYYKELCELLNLSDLSKEE